MQPRSQYAVLALTVACIVACAPADSSSGDVFPTPQLDGIARERRQVRFQSGSVTLAAELDLPQNTAPAPLVFVIHYSGPVPRDAYGYLAEVLVEKGYAVFRFDKRGTGLSGGEYGCCESDDALAAYRAAVGQEGIDRRSVFIVAQSIGTQHLAERFDEYAAIQPPRGVALLSNLLRADRIGAIAAPVHIIVSDSEPDLAGIGRLAAEAHRAAQPFAATIYVADHTEHTLFDIRAGTLDWSNSEWVRRYHRGAMNSLVAWLDDQQTQPWP